jgi:glyoxylase-like metal-dependent hydrolase (beta-lactamase superfamily II)
MAQDGIRRYRFSDLELIAIHDTDRAMPVSIFLQDPAALKAAGVHSDQHIASSINVFALRFADRVVLVDSGNGVGKGTLLDKLAQLNIKPADVTDVLLTHIHPDHIGGLVSGDVAIFANAAIHVAKAEADYWHQQAYPAGALNPRFFAAYAGKIATFAPGAQFWGKIRAQDAAGHTPGHTSFRMGRLWFIGDTVHGAALQFPTPALCARYDMDLDKAIAVRRTIMAEAARDDALIIGAHLPFPGIGSVRVGQHAAVAFQYLPYAGEEP